MTYQESVFVALKLLGGPEFSAQMKAAAGSAGLLGKTTEKAGKQIQTAGRRTFITSQALYTLRRYAFYGTIAIGAMGAAVVKLGYSYLSAMQNARVALSPVIKDQGTLNSYLQQLFQISKYSPFVISDLAIAFRQLFAGLHPLGISAPTILTTIQSLTDFMSFSGKIGPGALQRTALALQHMAYAGHLTGYAINQLSRDGIPIMAILNKEMGITGDQLHNISKMGVPAADVLNAINKYAAETPGVKNAALRLSLGTFSGLLQVVRDSLSQVSGSLISGAYGSKNSGIQGWLYNMVKKGGPLDKLSTFSGKKNHSGSDTLLFFSKQLTGGTGLGKGLLLLISIAKNLGTVFAKIVIPAWVLASKILILIYPSLKLFNLILGQMIKHATTFKIVLALLTAEFILTHTSILLMWSGMKLFQLATLGSIGPLINIIRSLKVLRTIELTGGISRLLLWAFATKQAGTAGAKFGEMVFVNTGLLAKLTRGIAALRGITLATSLVYLGWAGAIIGVVIALRQLDGAMNGQHKMTQFRGGKWDPVTWLAWPGQKILGRHAGGGMVSTRTQIVGENGPELAHLPMGTRITPSKSVSSVLSTVGGSIGGGERPIIVQLVVDRKVLAESVARANQDKKARR